MEIGLSEFSFGYAFLHEQTRRHWKKVIGVPILPSLREEAKLGWDVKLPTKGKDFYFQFKVSERFSRGNSKFIADGTYDGPYYRFKLHKYNQQHRLLWDNAQIHGNEETYYVAPEVPTNEKFKDAFLKRTVTENSRLIPLRCCRNYEPQDEEQHYITFKEGDANFIQHSEKKEEKESILGKEWPQILEQKEQSFVPIDLDFVEKLLDRTLVSVRRFIDPNRIKIIENLMEPKPAEDIYAKLNYAANLLTAAFDITMVIVGLPETGEHIRA